MPISRLALAALLVLSLAALAGGDEPPLPEGPGDEPPMPEGPSDEPPLPEGPKDKEPPPDEEAKPLEWLGLTGFWEARGGVRTQSDRYEKAASIGETRLQLGFEKSWQKLTFKLVTDFVYDPVLDHHSLRLETGQGWMDLRQASVAFSPAKFADVKIGRQILTWGTGDLIFINDLFPKDWQSFFIGRDVEYLKAPSDAVKIGLFSDLANVDVVYVPRFDADRFIRGRRLSYRSAALGRLAGRDAVVNADPPEEWFDDHEWAARVSRNLGGYELAGYGYWGYWKSPAGMDPATGRATFPRLSVYGGSVRGPLGKGIVNFEAGYYDSRQDRGGDDPLVRNGEVRLLAGYEQDLPRIARDLTVGAQYYVELMTDYGAYRRALLPGAKPAERDRHVLTFRVRKLLINQNLELSLFAFYSPSDSDAYLRPRVSYKIDDHWKAEIGGNVFLGAERHTFFGQFANNTNIYAALRCGF